MSEETVTIKTNKSDARVLFLLIAQYLHYLNKEQFDLAYPRLLIEFDKFANWLRSKGLELQ